MAEPLNPFRRRPRPPIAPAAAQPDPKKEDLGEAVPLGEPDDEGFLIEEEEREYSPPDAKKPKP